MAGPNLDTPNTSSTGEMTDEEKQQQKFAQECLSAVETREQEFETTWWVQAKDAERIYAADTKDQEIDTPYNILYSNTEVLLPSLYSATPKPDVRARYKGQNIKPLPEVLDRFLTSAADPASPGGDTFDGAMKDAVLSALVPGMGYVRLRYIKERSFPLTYESGHYRTLVWGKATRWSKVPWIAFKHAMRKQQMFEMFEIPPENQDGYKPSSESEQEKDDCVVWEFWDKKTKKVYFLSTEWGKKLLRTTDDPLGLENFFPTPGLMMMTMRGGKLLPIPLLNYYKAQANELNRVSARLFLVLSAIRVRGVYNSLLGDDLKKILSADVLENEMMPATEAGLLAQNGGFDKQIWMLPIEKLIIVAKELYQAREAAKQVIYELTGISDIIRGSSVASETATAQDLKNKWGTVRLRRMQTVVAEYARDLFRISVDCGADHIPPEKWAEICQMPEIPSAEQKAQAQQALAQAAQQAALAQQTAELTGQPAQPPQPPDPKLLAAMQAPSWPELLARIKSDLQRTFIVNIQTSSTVDLDTAQDKMEVNEFMNAMGQLLPGLQGLAAIGPTGMEAAKSILQSVCLRYKFGIDIADTIAKIEPPPPQQAQQKGPPPPSPEEVAAIKAKAQADTIRAQADISRAQSDMRVMQAEETLALAEVENKRQLLGIAVEEASLRLESARLKIAEQKAKPKPTTPAAPARTQ